MGKGNNIRGNKEAKKPKKVKTKTPATLNSTTGKAPLSVGGNKVK